MKDARRVRMYEERANWCAEVYLAKLPKGEVVAVLARQRGLAHTDTGSILLIRSTDGCRTWGPEPAGSHLWFTHSDDGGYFWSKPRNSGLWGYPADLLGLADGRVLCVYGYRHAPDPGIRACVSRDGMEWRKEDEFVIEADPSLTADQYHIGYPSAVQLDDGTVFAAYHMFSGDGRQFVTGTLFTV